jgi:hypothetical protein
MVKQSKDSLNIVMIVGTKLILGCDFVENFYRCIVDPVSFFNRMKYMDNKRRL